MKIEVQEYFVTFPDEETYFLVRCMVKNKSIKWKVLSHVYTLNKECKWEKEPLPSNRTDEYLYRNRHSFEEAIELLNKFKAHDE